MKHLVLGGARSGKSYYSEQAAQQSQKKCLYIATGQALDNEMQARIDHHKARRKSHWHVIEEPIALGEQLRVLSQPDTVVLIDCLTLWLNNCMHNQCFDEQKKQLLDGLMHTQCDVIMVSNEVGSGVVPLGQLSRDFVDNAGRLHQDIASLCERVTLVMAGLPLHLKGKP